MDMGPVLVVGAHPDDVDYATAGTMLLWSKLGREIHFVICTNGDKGGSANFYTSEELVRIRREEQEAASAMIGARGVYFLNRRDGELVADMDLKRDLVRIIRRVRPSTIFSFDPGNHRFDNFHLFHTDHRAAAIATFDAIFPASSNKMYFPELLEEGLEPYRVREVYFFGASEVNERIDISSVIDEKIKVLLCHGSQFDSVRRVSMEEFIRGHSRMNASGMGYEYGEAFRRLEFPW